MFSVSAFLCLRKIYFCQKNDALARYKINAVKATPIMKIYKLIFKSI